MAAAREPVIVGAADATRKPSEERATVLSILQCIGAFAKDDTASKHYLLGAVTVLWDGAPFGWTNMVCGINLFINEVLTTPLSKTGLEGAQGIH